MCVYNRESQNGIIKGELFFNTTNIFNGGTNFLHLVY